VRETRQLGRLSFKPVDTNVNQGQNVLSIVVDADRARLNANLAFYDGLDGKTDWPLSDQGEHPLTEFLLADFLVIDIAKPFFTFMVGGVDGPYISDGVDQATQPASRSFPYLASPNPNPPPLTPPFELPPVSAPSAAS
jgi:hypothetical protein